MKKILFIISIFFSTIMGTFSQEQITVTRFQGQKITGIEAHGIFNITVKQGNSTGVSVNIPARLEKRLTLKLNPEGKLQIYIDEKTSNKNKRNKNNKPFTAEVTVTNLNNVKLTGVCKLKTIEDFVTNKLKVDISGVCKMSTEGNFGVKEKLEIKINGVSQFQGQITSSESSIEVNGASRLDLKGNTEHCKLQVSGASKALLEEFSINILRVEISGTSKAQLQVKEELSIYTSGIAKATYIGDPRIIAQRSTGISNINKISPKSPKNQKEYEK